MKNIVFVCHANICRSPMAEFLMKEMLVKEKIQEEIIVYSAAVSKVRLGEPIFEKAFEQMLVHGFGKNPELSKEENQLLLQELNEKRAEKFTFKDYKNNDLVIIMDEDNRKKIRFDTGDDIKGKVHRLLEYTEEVRDVEDPWITGNFEAAYHDILRGCIGLLACLKGSIQ